MSGFEELLLSQSQTMRSIERALTNYKKLGREKMTVATTTNRMTLLTELYHKCQELDAKLQQIVDPKIRPSISYFTSNQFESCEAIYQETMDYMAEKLHEASPSTSSGTSANQPSEATSRTVSRLPRINLPSFDGTFENWESFKDKFQSLVINDQSLSKVDKLHYLDSALQGDAKRAIQHLQITEANFNIAWKALTARFDNKRRLITTHLKALFSLPKVMSESPRDLRQLRDKLMSATQALRNLDRPVDSWSDILVFLGVQRLDYASRKAWELNLGKSVDYPTFDEFDEFLEAQIIALESLAPVKRDKPISTDIKPSSKNFQAHAAATNTITCPICKGNHLIYQCPVFLAKSPADRYNLIRSQKRCSNCFSIKHNATQCPNKSNCKECNQRHNTLLHFPTRVKPEESPKETASLTNSTENEISSHLAAETLSNSILLSTARVRVSSRQGRSKNVRALLDQGSVATFISADLAQFLRLRKTKQPICVTGIGQSKSLATHTAVLRITPTTSFEPAYETRAVILPSLTQYVPNVKCDLLKLSHLAGLNLADGDPMSSDPVEMIIGADLYGQLLVDGIKRGSTNEPVAQNTTLGWVLSGPVNSSHLDSLLAVHHTTVLEPLAFELRRFWELEDIPSGNSMSPENKICELHFSNTHSRTIEGRYVVRLPFKTNKIPLGDSRKAAVCNVLQRERRFLRDTQIAEEYRNFLREYEDLGHMRRVAPLQSGMPGYFIPHHAVLRDSSATTRLRVVFNASCRTSNGTSLNEFLLSGPNLQTDLTTILLRWRQFQFVYTADIEKMYRQILVDERDRDFQRILWRSNPTDDISEFQLCTVTYGTTSAPFLAIRVLQQLVVDEGNHYPLAVPVLKHQTYVDDCLFGADDLQQLRAVRHQLNALLAKGGFRLRKWASNQPELLSDIDPSNHGLAHNQNPAEKTLSVLGLAWNASSDSFQFRPIQTGDPPSTKRAVLSTIARLFDPLGWITPVVITAKVFIQRLWLSRRDWDEQIPDDVQQDWLPFFNQIANLAELRIPRKVSPNQPIKTQLHGFADASTKAYAAVVYQRTTLSDGSVSVNLLAAKSRVAPLKTVTVPRLELCAALLLAKLIVFLKNSLQYHEVDCYCWTDSSITIQWLSQPPIRWKTFVANRVAKIQRALPDISWRYVPTGDNPADCASRGLYPSQIHNHALWWNGPPWLSRSSDSWPVSLQRVNDDTTEERARELVSAVATRESWQLMTRYSSWPKLLRVTAYLYRFLNKTRRNNSQKTHLDATPSNPVALQPWEVERAKLFWLRYMQAESFPTEFQFLKDSKPVPKSSPISALVPFIDTEGLLRARSRLVNSPLSEKAKTPVILRSHPLLRLIIMNTHLQNLHAGPLLTLAKLRNEFWILRARATVRSVLYNCVPCTREKAAVPTELMGNLPAARVTEVKRAFIHVGVDYAGPILVRPTAGRGYKARKAYIALFICLTTKAIHLELVNDYSSAAFVAAFHRFAARRGMPTWLYSDNGTTFQGANRELDQAFRAAANDPNFANQIAVDGVEWKFIPPAAPHFGGLWEAAIKSVKTHLKRCIGSHTLTQEEFGTLLCRIEACLNSRPLAAMSNCIDDFEVLTPAHFLIGTNLATPPEPSVLNLKEERLSRWQMVQRIAETFWKAWSNDYLHTLHQRPKWRTVQKLTKVGQIVLLRKANCPPSMWELARITACHPGDDGLVRVVKVRTARTEYVRPISKICFLPIPINEEDEGTDVSSSDQQGDLQGHSP